MPAPRSIAESDWCAAKAHVARTLMTLARAPGLKESERIISYGDLDLSIQTALPGIRIPYFHWMMRNLLNEVCDASSGLGCSAITSLVVRQDFRRPGKGLREYLQKQGKTMQDVLEEQRSAISFWRSDRADELLRRLGSCPPAS